MWKGDEQKVTANERERFQNRIENEKVSSAYDVTQYIIQL